MKLCSSRVLHIVCSCNVFSVHFLSGFVRLSFCHIRPASLTPLLNYFNVLLHGFSVLICPSNRLSVLLHQYIAVSFSDTSCFFLILFKKLGWTCPTPKLMQFCLMTFNLPFPARHLLVLCSSSARHFPFRTITVRELRG